jgi:hypothetical protein
MTRTAARRGFDHYVSEMMDVAFREFDVVAAMTDGSRRGSNRVVNRLLKKSERLERRVVKPELDDYERSIEQQFDIVLDYAADRDASFDEYRDDILARDLFARQLDPGLSSSEAAAVRDRILERHRTIGEATRPLLDADADEFWDAMVETFDHEEARDRIEQYFAFTDPVRDHPDAFRFETTVDTGAIVGGIVGKGLPSITVEFTEEAIRTMHRAETVVTDRALREADRQYDAG